MENSILEVIDVFLTVMQMNYCFRSLLMGLLKLSNQMYLLKMDLYMSLTK